MSGPARVVWHLGVQKTGTTTIQRTIERNDAVFARHGALFVKDRRTLALWLAAMAYVEERTDERRAELVQRLSVVRAAAEAHPARTALVSEETILGAEVYNAHGNLVEWAGLLMPVLAEAVAPAASRFVLYTRAFEAWARSAYNQSVKTRRYTQSFRAWRDAIPFPSDWAEIRARLPAELDITLVQMESEKDGLLGRALFDAFGLSGDEIAALEPVDVRNQSLPPGAVAFMLSLNRSSLDEESLATVRLIVHQHAAAFR